MNFPKFWARGVFDGYYAWRWSFSSLTEAQSLANEAAKHLAERLKSGARPNQGGHYYPDRPAREQIMQEMTDARGVSAVVTRNSYGCKVLNTARVMFVDIDLPEPRRQGLGFSIRILNWRWPKPTLPPDTSGPRNAALARVEEWTRNNYQWGWRVYQTRSGLRLMATQGTVEADSKTTDDIFEALGADPLYRKLCKTQKCFRARLTPKPWRCGTGNPPNRWPWLTPKAEQRFQKWLGEYESDCEEWATCTLLRQIGNATVHPDVQPIIKLHDEAARVGSNLELA